jgi:mitochondrial import inner membrane translocase subunit TIM50
VQDVRKVIESVKGKDIPTEYARREALLREDWEKQRAADKAKRPHRGGISLLGGALGVKAQEDKPLMEQIRERGMKQYELLEKEIRENGEKWLKEMEAEDKKLQDEQMKSMRGSFFSFFGGPGGEESGDGQAKAAGEGSKP